MHLREIPEPSVDDIPDGRGVKVKVLRVGVDGTGVAWSDVWPLLVIGIDCIPLGLWIFSLGETYAKRHGKLKRSG